MSDINKIPIIDKQELIKIVEYTYDKNGKLIEKRTEVQNVLDWVQENGVAAVAGATDTQMIQITIAAGKILEIWNLSIQSEAGNKPYAIGTSTATPFAAPFSGMAGASFKWAGTTGTGLVVNLTGLNKPLVVIDNSAGSANLYCYIFAYTGYLDIVQVNGEKMGASYSGLLYQPT